MQADRAKCWGLLYIVLCMIIILGVVGLVRSQEISQHNEQQAALRKAYGLLFEAGCVRPDHTRTDRYKLVQDADRYYIDGNRLTVVCAKWSEEDQEPVLVSVTAVVSWDAPTTREGGTALPDVEIAGYKVAHNGELTVVVGGALSLEYLNLTTGDHFFTVQTVDVDGLMSQVFGPVQLTVE